MFFRLMTAAIVAACTVLVGCSSDSTPRKIKPGEIIKAGETVEIDLSSFRLGQASMYGNIEEALKEYKDRRQVPQVIEDCRLNELFNVADKVYKTNTGNDPPDRSKLIEQLIDQGYLIQDACSWKIHKGLYDFLLQVERRKMLAEPEKIGPPKEKE